MFQLQLSTTTSPLVFEHQRRNIRRRGKRNSPAWTSSKCWNLSAGTFRPCSTESIHWQELSQNKEEAPSPITSTWDRYLLQECGSSRAAPNKIHGGPTAAKSCTSCGWTKISCLCRSSSQQSSTTTMIATTEVIGVFRNDTTIRKP